MGLLATVGGMSCTAWVLGYLCEPEKSIRTLKLNIEFPKNSHVFQIEMPFFQTIIWDIYVKSQGVVLRIASRIFPWPPVSETRWWFFATHLKKYAQVKLDSPSPNSRVENKQYLSCHHPRYVHGVNPHEKMCCNRCNPWKFILKQHYLNPSKQHEIRWTCKVFKELASEPRKNPLAFHCTVCLIGILTIVYGQSQ